MKRKFVTNLAFLIFLNLLIKPFWIFGIDRTVQNTLGAEEYGLYFSLFSFSILLNIILDSGITNFNNRGIARDSSFLPESLSNIIPLKLILGVIYAIVCITAGLMIGYTSEQFNLLYLLIFNNFLLSFILYLRSNISGLHLFKTDSILSVLDRLLMILICSVLLWGKITDTPLQLKWFIYAQTVSYVITLVIAFGIVFYHSGKIRFRINLNYWLKILKGSLPFAVLILLMSFFNRIDSVMIERILADGKEQAGIYAQSFRILDAASMFAFLFAALLLPMFSRMIKNNEAIGQLLRLSFSLLIIPALIIVVISSFYGQEIISILYNEYTSASSRIYTRLIFTFIFISITYIFGSLLTANGNLRQLNILAGITVFINVLLNFNLIPLFKAEGAVYASLASQGFFAFSQIILSKRIFKLEINYSLIFKYLIFILVMILTGFFFERMGIFWIYGLFSLLILGIFYSLLLRILKPEILSYFNPGY